MVKLEASSQTVATYEYDGNNRRIIKGVYSAGTLASTRHVYYSMQAQALEERVDSGTDAEIQFIWNLNYVDDLLLRDRDTNSNGTLDERLYSLPDLRYCVMALADTSGSIVERFKYEVYGQSQAMTDLFVDRSSSSYDWEFRYTGRREDLETGLLFFRARFYSAQLGRFISRDPLGFVDGMNLYRAYFVPGGVDPSGKTIRRSDDEYWWPGKYCGRGFGALVVGGCRLCGGFPTDLPPPGPCGGNLTDPNVQKVYDVCMHICRTIPVKNPTDLGLDGNCEGLKGVVKYICEQAAGFIEGKIPIPNIKEIACNKLCCSGTLPEGMPGDECFPTVFDENGNRKSGNRANRNCTLCCEEKYPTPGDKDLSICTQRCGAWTD